MFYKIFYWLNNLLDRLIINYPKIRDTILLFCSGPVSYINNRISLSILPIKILFKIKIYSLRVVIAIISIFIGTLCLIYIPDLHGVLNGTLEYIANLHSKYINNNIQDISSLMVFLATISCIFVTIVVICVGLFIKSNLVINKRFDQAPIGDVVDYKKQAQKSNRGMWNIINFIGPLIISLLIFVMTYHLGPQPYEKIDIAQIKADVKSNIENKMRDNGYYFLSLSDKDLLEVKCIRGESTSFLVKKRNNSNEEVLINVSCEVKNDLNLKENIVEVTITQ